MTPSGDIDPVLATAPSLAMVFALIACNVFCAMTIEESFESGAVVVNVSVLAQIPAENKSRIEIFVFIILQPIHSKL